MPKYKLFVAAICCAAGLFFSFLLGLTFHASGPNAFNLMSTYFLSLVIMGNFSVLFFYFYNKLFVLPVFTLTTLLTLAGSSSHAYMHIEFIELVSLIQVVTLGGFVLWKTKPIAKSLLH